MPAGVGPAFAGASGALAQGVTAPSAAGISPIEGASNVSGARTACVTALAETSRAGEGTTGAGRRTDVGTTTGAPSTATNASLCAAGIIGRGGLTSTTRKRGATIAGKDGSALSAGASTADGGTDGTGHGSGVVAPKGDAAGGGSSTPNAFTRITATPTARAGATEAYGAAPRDGRPTGPVSTGPSIGGTTSPT